MSDRNCAQQGHHWHEPDGTIFNRKRDRITMLMGASAGVTAHCCHCATVATKTGYGDRNPAAPSMVACGEFVTVEEG